MRRGWLDQSDEKYRGCFQCVSNVLDLNFCDFVNAYCSILYTLFLVNVKSFKINFFLKYEGNASLFFF